MDILIFALLLAVVAIVFIVLVHLLFKETLHHVLNAYNQSIHAHDDAAVRIADHRRLDNERIAMVMRWGEEMAKHHKELAQFVLAEIHREDGKDDKDDIDADR